MVACDNPCDPPNLQNGQIVYDVSLWWCYLVTIYLNEANVCCALGDDKMKKKNLSFGINTKAKGEDVVIKLTFAYMGSE